MAEEYNPNQQQAQGINFLDLEERQRIVKDRLTLVSQNLIDFKEKNESDILQLKKEIEILKTTVDRLKDFIETISNEFSKFAKKEDVEILRKQAKIFQPLNFITREDLDKLKRHKNI